jgi:hypothetical protein
MVGERCRELKDDRRLTCVGELGIVEVWLVESKGTLEGVVKALVIHFDET